MESRGPLLLRSLYFGGGVAVWIGMAHFPGWVDGGARQVSVTRRAESRVPLCPPWDDGASQTGSGPGAGSSSSPGRAHSQAPLPPGWVRPARGPRARTFWRAEMTPPPLALARDLAAVDSCLVPWQSANRGDAALPHSLLRRAQCPLLLLQALLGEGPPPTWGGGRRGPG